MCSASSLVLKVMVLTWVLLAIEVSGAVTHGSLRARLLELPLGADPRISHQSICWVMVLVIVTPAILGQVGGPVLVNSVSTLPENSTVLALARKTEPQRLPCLNMVWSFLVPMLIKSSTLE